MRLNLAAAGLAAAALAIAGTLLAGAQWASQPQPLPAHHHFLAGPLGPGEALEQAFTAPVDHLTRLRLRLAVPESDMGSRPQVIARLRDGDDLVQEMRFDRLDLGTAPTDVWWDFAPLAGVRGRTLTVQVAVGQASPARLLAAAHLTDRLPGSLVTNGIPAGSHVDLDLASGRVLSIGGIARAIGSAAPAGLLLVGAGVAAAGVLGGAAQIRRRAGRAPWADAAWPVLGVALALLVLGVAIRTSGAELEPERDPAFWKKVAIGLAVVAAAPWARTLARGVSRRLDTLAAKRLRSGSVSEWVAATWRDGGPAALALALASAVSLAALTALILTDAGRVRYPMEIFDDLRPNQGRVGLLPPGLAVGLAQWAFAAWLLYAVVAMRAARGAAKAVRSLPTPLESVARLRWILGYGAVFVVAYVFRLAPYLRNDLTPWWDGWGLGHGDTWIDLAVPMAEMADLSVFADIHNEGFLYVPLLAGFIKALGLWSGMVWFGHFLVVTSALIPVLAAATVTTLTGRQAGGIVAGLVLAFDPVLIWFGLNGWSDGATFFAVALAFLAFAAAARRPSVRTLVALGLALTLLALSHGTWLYPAVFWAAAAGPLIAARARWLTGAGPYERSRKLLAAPLVTLALGYVAMGAFQWSRFPPPNGIRGLADVPLIGHSRARDILSAFSNTFGEPSRAAGTPESIVGAAGRWLAELGEHVSFFIDAHVVQPFPFFPLIMAVVGVAALWLAWRRHRAVPVSRPGLAVLPVLAVPVFWPALEASTAGPTFLLVLALVWLFAPAGRAIYAGLALYFAVFLPIAEFGAHMRHTNVLIYAFILTGVTLIDAAAREGAPRLPWRAGLIQTLVVRRAMRVAVPSLVGALIVVGLVGVAHAAGERATERAYLTWLGSNLPGNALVLTAGNVDPWTVVDLTGRSVLYDAENRGRQLIEGRPFTWTHRVPRFYPDATESAQIISALVESGAELYYYGPGSEDRSRVTPHFLGARTTYALTREAAYPGDPRRAVLRIGEAIAGG